MIMDAQLASPAMAAHLSRPHLTWAELCQSPLHDFPIRDEVLYQYLDWSPDLNVLEIGPGSGFTAFWLCRQVRQMTLLDAAAQTIDDLRAQLGSLPNVDLVAADAAQPGLAALLKSRFDVAFGLDVFDLIPDPIGTLRNLGESLKPGGQLLLSFPNVPPPRAKGVTCFARTEEIELLLKNAGFARWEICNIRLAGYAAGAYEALHERPLRLFRRLRRSEKNGRPQVYDATWAFRNRGAIGRYKSLVHLYWKVVDWALRQRGPIFVQDLNRQSILNGQLLVRAWRS